MSLAHKTLYVGHNIYGDDMHRLGKYTLITDSAPSIVASAGVVGKTEGEGPLTNEFDRIFTDDLMGKDSFEQAESELQREAVERLLTKASLPAESVDMIFAGDLLNQCTASTFGLKDFGIPLACMFGACSTMALTLATACAFVDSGACTSAIAVTSSHFCTAERQFRQPLEYGGQRPQSAQRTVTGAGAALITAHRSDCPSLRAVTYGAVTDFEIRDANNMGAAMAPAAAATIHRFLDDTGTKADEYSKIVTGDLGFVGSELLCELMMRDYGIDISGVHEDCGKLIFDREAQDVHSGGSGCGCSASVLNTRYLRLLKSGELKRILFVATGALLSPTTSLQGETIPSIAHLVLIEKPENLN